MEVCRLCLDLATASDVKKLEGTYKDATQIVLPELNTDISSSPVICQPCTSSLDELYAFKASVVEAEHQIKEKVGDDKCQLQLKEVMTGVKIDKDADLGKSKDRMCRTCLCAIEGETFTVLKPTQTDAYLNSMLLMCLPEMDLELTLDPVMCEQCLCNLQKLYHFKSSCLDVEERLNNYCQQHGTSSSNQINLHSVLEEDAAESKHNDFAAVKSEPIDSSVGDYKSEEDDEDVSMSDNSKDLGYTVVKVKKEERDMALKEEDDTEDGDESMGDDDGNITDEEIGELKQEELKIEDDEGDGSKKSSTDRRRNAACNSSARGFHTKMPLVKCDQCEFTTKNNKFLKLHTQRRHIRAEPPLLKCELCDYSSQFRINLNSHFRRNHTELPKLKCKYCDYATKHDSDLKLHVMRKHTLAELPLIKCDFCDYSSQLRDNLRKHFRRIHKELPILKCKHCDHVTKHNSDMKLHVERKHTRAELPVLKRDLVKCEQCDFTTTTNKYLKVHVQRRHIRSDPLMKCQLCDYSSQSKYSLGLHFTRKHTDRPLLHCGQCEFVTKNNKSLKRHTELYHCQTKVPLLKCDLCSYTSQFKTSLQKHFKQCHDGLQLMKCDLCSYTFLHSKKYRKHVRIHHTDRR